MPVRVPVVYVSYHGTDAGRAARIEAGLKQRLGHGYVYRDAASPPAPPADAVLLVLGPDWAAAADSSDPPWAAAAEASKAGKPVGLLLAGGTLPPNDRSLPPGIRGIPRPLTDDRLDADLDAIAAELRRLPTEDSVVPLQPTAPPPLVPLTPEPKPGVSLAAVLTATARAVRAGVVGSLIGLGVATACFWALVYLAVYLGGRVDATQPVPVWLAGDRYELPLPIAAGVLSIPPPAAGRDAAHARKVTDTVFAAVLTRETLSAMVGWAVAAVLAGPATVLMALVGRSVVGQWGAAGVVRPLAEAGTAVGTVLAAAVLAGGRLDTDRRVAVYFLAVAANLFWISLGRRAVVPLRGLGYLLGLVAVGEGGGVRWPDAAAAALWLPAYFLFLCLAFLLVSGEYPADDE